MLLLRARILAHISRTAFPAGLQKFLQLPLVIFRLRFRGKIERGKHEFTRRVYSTVKINRRNNRLVNGRHGFFVVTVVGTAYKRLVQPEPYGNGRKRAVGDYQLTPFGKTALA